MESIMTFRNSALAACLTILVTAISADEVDVYLLSGQSNMQGSGLVSDVPNEIGPIPHAHYWNGEEFEPLVFGTTPTSRKRERFGPEIGFAQGMASESSPRPHRQIRGQWHAAPSWVQRR